MHLEQHINHHIPRQRSHVDRDIWSTIRDQDTGDGEEAFVPNCELKMPGKGFEAITGVFADHSFDDFGDIYCDKNVFQDGVPRKQMQIHTCLD
jgi:hypothetical protein